MVFDWIKAAKLIKELGAQYAEAGLSSDWEWTGGVILKEGNPVKRDDSGCYLASTWAKPEIEINGTIIECFIMQSNTNEWDAHTFWPKEALDILIEKG